jgi:diguanylate cyclase (GGDEF)-like protein
MVAAIAFVVVVILFFVALAGWRAWEERRAELERVQTTTANLARSTAQHMQDAIKVADALLTGVVDRVENQGFGEAQSGRMRPLLESYVREFPQLHGIVLLDEKGSYLVGSQDAPANLNNSDLAYFQYHLAQEEAKTHIGNPVRSRTTGDWIVPISKRFEHPDGRFAGVALATISMDYFHAFYRDIEIGPRGVIFVAFGDGTLLTRHPLREEVLGIRLPNPIINPANFSLRPAGSFEARSRIDGVERLYGFRYLDNYPLVATVGLSRDDALAGWRTDMLAYGAGLIAMSLVLGFLGWRLIGAIRAGLHYEKHLIETHASLKRMNRTLESMALQDALTGIANRRQFDSVLAAEYNRAIRTELPLSVMMIDVDYFKQFNDIYGHPEGDRCLRQLSEVLNRTLARAGDLAARYGGEEFAVLLPNTELGNAEMLAQRLCHAVELVGIPHRGSPFGKVTVSVGVSSFAPGVAAAHRMTHQEDLVHAADQALYIAKRNGRNQVCATDRNVSSLFAAEDDPA